MLALRVPAFWRGVTSRPRRWLALAIVVAVLVPIALWAWVTVVTREVTYETALADQRRVTEALRQHTLKLFETKSLVLDLVDRQAGARDCPAMRLDRSLQEFMAIATRRASGAGSIWVIDANGFLCVSSNPDLMDTRSRAFREYFAGARNIAPERYYVDRAVNGLIGGVMVFDIAKPRMKDGRFNGIILTSVDIASLAQSWRSLGDPPTQRFSLFRIDGATIAHSWPPFVPERDDAAERRVANPWSSAEVQGSRIGPSLIDHALRIGAWRKLPEWGVVVTSSVDEVDVLRPWRRSVVIYGMLALLASTMLAGLVWSLLRGQRRLAWTVEQRTRALRFSEDKLNLFIDGAPIGIALFDTEMRYLAVSRRYLTERRAPFSSPEDIIGLSHYEVFPNSPSARRQFHRRVFSGETLSSGDELYSHADGTTDWISWSMAPWHQPDGTVGGAVQFFEVVTARKQAEIILSRGKEELEQLVVERTRELQATQARLAHGQRMEALGQLAGGIAHDFNNVIQAVLGGAYLIERRPGEADRSRSLARMIVEAAGRGAGITRRLLAFSRQSDLLAEPIDVLSLLAGIQEILAHTIGVAIEVKLEGEAGVPALLADKGQLETVLVNLATNARDAMPGGGIITLAACLENLREGAATGYPVALQSGFYVQISVSDDGTGMTPAVLARASEPFFTTKEVGQGTGLGLAMARGFAEQSGGGLQIESAVGHGTVVRLWFPVAIRAAVPVMPPPERADVAVIRTEARARFLIVDDDAIVRETLAQQMEMEGYAVLVAADGPEALRLLDDGEPVDLIISDYSMPTMDGLTLIRQAQLRRPSLPAILLTGFAANAAEIAINGALSGTFTMLRKPINGATLAERAAGLLERVVT